MTQIKDLSREFSEVERERINAFSDILSLKSNYHKDAFDQEVVTITGSGDFVSLRVTVSTNEQTDERELVLIETSFKGSQKTKIKIISELDRALKTYKG